MIGGRDRHALAAAPADLSRFVPAVVQVDGDITDATVVRDSWRPRGSWAAWTCSSTTRRSSGASDRFSRLTCPVRALFPVNVGAPLVLIQLAVPLLAERRGLIVNITSDAATAAYPGWGPYGATKAALELLTRTMATELGERGVSAVLVDPGDMRTRMHQEAFPGEDISNRPLPEVTEPFWHWLFDQDPGRSAASDSRLNWRMRRGRSRRSRSFTLPARLEAAEPPEARGLRRDGVRLLVSRADAESIDHSRFSELPRWLSAGDLLVVNTSGTLKAALAARTSGRRQLRAAPLHAAAGGLLGGRGATAGSCRFSALSARGRRDHFEPDAGGRIVLLAPYPSTELSMRRLDCGWRHCSWGARAAVSPTARSPIRYSYVPAAWPASMYQTVFATEPGSAEMPSAGRPFTPSSSHGSSRTAFRSRRCCSTPASPA